MGKFTIDVDIKEKIDVLAENFSYTPAYKYSTSSYNPYHALAQAIDQHARPQDTRVLIAVIDKIAQHKNPNETHQGATEGNAIGILAHSVNLGATERLIDININSPQNAVDILSKNVLQKAEDLVRQKQIEHELMMEQQRESVR